MSKAKETILFTDELTRRLYANDASMYEEVPVAVHFPDSEKDIIDLVLYAGKTNTPITARAAGTSLAGQTTGGGIVMDSSRYMNRILELNPEKATALVQPGVIRDTLNREAAPHLLQFGPDTSTTNRCMIGGMIGNNSAGSFSIKYKTTREHTISVRAVLSDGSVAVFHPLSKIELEEKTKFTTLEGSIYRKMLSLLEKNANLIKQSSPHPEIIRRNTGFALDRLLEMEPFTSGGRPFNLAELLCGSEGTLAMTSQAELRLVPVPKFKVLAIPHFENLNNSMEATILAVKYGPSAVELVDDIVLGATKLNVEQNRNRFFLNGEPAAILIIEFEGDNVQDLIIKADKVRKEIYDAGLSYASPVFSDFDSMNRVWELRRAGLGLLMGLWSDTKTPEFMDDTSVRVEDLPSYIRDIQELIRRYETTCVYYAHASVGELHLRPELNLSTHEGLEKMKKMAADVAGIVKKYRGSLSGEHGDGRVRAPFLEIVLGSEMISVLKQVKHIWDPQNIFNPGKIVDPKPMHSDLRFYPGHSTIKVESLFHWRDQNGFHEAIDRCNGAGVCRKLADSGGTMCPSYMATGNEKDTTRGRANIFRQMFRGRRLEAFESEELKDALSLCLSCKACKTECPANVDMARMKAEFSHGWHQRKGATISEYFFAFPEKIYPLASMFPRLVNIVNHTKLAKYLLRAIFKIHSDRDLPHFASRSFYKWFKERKPANPDGPPVLILNDIFMNYHDPEIGIAMVRVLEHTGLNVMVTKPTQSGRTSISKGFLKHARKTASDNVRTLSEYINHGMPVIGQEPSEILTLRDEYLDLVDENQLNDAKKLASQTYLFEEFMLKNNELISSSFDGLGKSVQVHAHCHTKALTGTKPVMELLISSGYQPVDLKTGCCGMAGSFGYEKDHYEVSQQIGNLKLFPALRSLPENELICAHGFSCRHQIADGVKRKSLHTAQLLEMAITQKAPAKGLGKS